MFKKLDAKSLIIGVMLVGISTFGTYFFLPPPQSASAGSCDEDRIIGRILFCLDGATISGGRISTYCNR